MRKGLAKILAPVVFGAFSLAFLAGCASNSNIRVEKRKIPGIGDTKVLTFNGKIVDYDVKEIKEIKGSKVTYITYDGFEKTYTP